MSVSGSVARRYARALLEIGLETKKLRPLLELAGIRNLLTKAYGSTSPKNLLRAGIEALQKLRSAEEIAKLRGVTFK